MPRRAPWRSARTIPAACVVTGLLATAMTTAAPTAYGAVDGRELLLTAEATALRSNDGGVVLQSRTVTRNGGTITREGSPSGRAYGFPAHRASGAPIAVMTFVDPSGADDLTPGTRDFSFGADVLLDSRSEGGARDNGDNVVQRGLFGARMQFKIQVDHRRPSCRVKGDRGAVQAGGGRAISPGTWYRLTCERQGSTVTLRVDPVGAGSGWTARANGATGSLTPPSRSTPLSVGGKATSATSLARSTDQFNGRLDNVFLNIR